MAPYTQLKTEHKTVREAMELWATHGERYRTNISRYNTLLDRKRQLGIKPLKRLTKQVLKEYPDLPFLRIAKREDALEFLYSMRISDVRAMIRHINYELNFNYSYNTICSRIIDFDVEIYNFGKRPSMYAIDPGCVRNKYKGSSGVKEDC